MFKKDPLNKRLEVRFTEDQYNGCFALAGLDPSGRTSASDIIRYAVDELLSKELETD